MGISFAAILHRPAEVSDEALAHGVAVAVAGFDVPAPHVLVAPIPGFPGWSAAFYRSGKKGHAAYDELDHACELFEDELPPGLAVRDAAAECGATGAVVYSLVYDDESLHDDAWRFDERGFVRRFVRDGDDGPEAGAETLEDATENPIAVDVAEDASDASVSAAIDLAVGPHRGSTFLASELGAPVLEALIGALFAADRRVTARLVGATPEAITREVQALNSVLRRTDGRGAIELPALAFGAAIPAAYAAFARTYDWCDPSDPCDLYRELAIGRIEGALRFFRPAELATMEAGEDAAFARDRKLFPIASLTIGLGGSRATAMIALAEDGEHLVLATHLGANHVEKVQEAGPTFGELLRYLALGWKSRNEVEEDLIGALMLRARVRVEAEAERRGAMRHGL